MFNILGIFNFFRNSKFKKELKNSIEQYEANRVRYLEMSTDELKGLTDDALFEATCERIENKVESFEELSEGFNSLNDLQKAVFSLNLLEMEVNDGGLCQFFVNSSRAVAPFVSEYLGLVGADKHKALFDDFIAKTDIDLNDLSSFIIDDLDEFEKQVERYPFDEYDDKFYELDPIQVYLEPFTRANLENLNTFS